MQRSPHWIALTLLFLGSTSSADEVWLDTLDLSGIVQGWGSPQARKSVEGHTLTIAGKKYERGVGTHAESEFAVDLKGACARFSAEVGVDAEIATSPASIEFQVYADDKLLFESGVVRHDTPAKAVDVEVKGAKMLRLVVTDAGDGIDYDHADWADAKVTLVEGAKERPAAFVLPRGPGVVLTPKPPKEPRITCPRVYGASPGVPFLFTITATGDEPIRFSAVALPPGLALDAATGRITGSMVGGGYHITVTAENAAGKDSRMVRIGDCDLICLTPPMGWSTWYGWGTSITDAKVRAAADAMVASGLAKHGWSYINIDDAWEGGRDKQGNILANEKFPDMKALCDYIHAKGLKVGIYSSPGPKTCAGYTGSLDYEAQDAKTYAAWGVDFLKYDWCSCTDTDLQRPYKVMNSALRACGRDIVYSLCQYGMGNVWEWGADVGGNCWRTTGDITDTWGSMSTIGFGQNGKETHAGPGRWNDPDNLQVGMIGIGPELRPTRLTPDEQYTQVTLWSLLSAPLIIGAELTKLDDFTLGLLTNDEVIAVDQDPLGRQAYRVRKDGNAEVWAKPLEDGTVAVGLFNRGLVPTDVTVEWKDVPEWWWHLEGPPPVRDLWRQQDLGAHDGHYTASVAPHGTVLLRVGTPPR